MQNVIYVGVGWNAPKYILNFVILGDKSEVLDIDTPDLQCYPEFVKACRFECVLEPGDLLFIPGKPVLD